MNGVKYSRTLQEAYEKRTGYKKIFAYDVPCKYIVASEKDFFHKVLKPMDPKKRYFYEVIEEETPCHLYIDLDVNLSKYPDIDVHRVKDMVCMYVETGLKDHVIDQCIISDSSNEKKGSLHILYILKDMCWMNNAHVGAFMRCCFEKHVKNHPEHTKLWQFVDMGVYTRNRLFRMLGCTKKNENRIKVVPEYDFNFENWKKCLIQPEIIHSLDEFGTREPDGSDPEYKGHKTKFIRDHNTEITEELVDFAKSVSMVRGVNYSPLFRTWSINLTTQDCVFKGHRHGKNTNYLVISKEKRTFMRRCWCQKYKCCRDGYTEPEALPIGIIKMMQKYDMFMITPIQCSERKPSH